MPGSTVPEILPAARRRLGLGELARQGIRPRRTLILCFWDAEEMLLGGSTEWVEDKAEELLGDESRAKAAASQLSQISRMIYLFYRPEGRPGAPLARNIFSGGSYDFEGVSGSTLPGIRFALDKDETETAGKEAEIYIAALERRLGTLASIRQKLRQIR